jgi:putative DNA primase/helicase
VWEGTKYRIWSKTQVKGFAQKHFFPKPSDRIREEFAKYLSATEHVGREFFSEHLNGLINFKNGVLDIKTRELLPHSPERGFMYCLPYDYEPNAKAPRFEQFLDEVTGKDKGLRAVLEEFGGYAISGDEYWLQKTLLLVGSGANGKSAFIDTLKMVAGSENYSTASLQDLRNENMRQLLEGKLFNVSPELSRHSLKESEKFKFLSDGSEITVKLMYNQPYKIKNRAKMIFACNDLPESGDASYGFLRRFAIIHFNQIFIKEKQDKFILRKLQRELPGILNIFLNGYDRLCKQQDFTFSASMETEKELYAVDNNPIQMFLDASPNITVHAINGGAHFTATTELKKAFDEWCLNNGLERAYSNMNLEWFGRMLASSVSDGKQRKVRKMIGGLRLSGFSDIQMSLDA